MNCEHCGERIAIGEPSTMIPLVEPIGTDKASVRPCWYHHECAAVLVIGCSNAEPGRSKRDAARAALDAWRSDHAWD